jgi:hypothetical protein
MEPLIVDATPKGSAILAYGTSRGPRWNSALLAIVAGGVVLLMLALFGAWLVRATVMLPEQRLITAVVQPRALAEQLNPVVVHDLPPSWRAVLASRSQLPALFGVAYDDAGTFHAFAVMARSSAIAAEPGLTVDTHGLLRVLHDGADIPRESVSLFHAFTPFWKSVGHDGAFHIRADVFARLGMQEGMLADTDKQDASEIITGTWDGTVAKLDLSSESAEDALVQAPLFAVLGDAQEGVVPIAQGLLSQGIDLQTASIMPYTLALDPFAEGTVYLYWRAPLSLNDGRILSAARGINERALLTLQDNTTHPEFQFLRDDKSTTGPTSVYLGQLSPSSTLFMPPSAPTDGCQGTTRFLVQDVVFQSILRVWGIPESVGKFVNGMRVTDSNKGVFACFY